MKLNSIRDIKKAGFTLAELLMALAMGSLMLAAVLTASIALQKSFNAADGYFATSMLQIRVIDYLSRDVKRSYIVRASSDRRTVTCTIPNYLVQAGDPDANGGNIGTRRKPTILKDANGITANYAARTVRDGTITSGSNTLTSFLAVFNVADVGQSVAGAGIPDGTKIQSYVNATTVRMSNNATSTVVGDTVTIGALTTVVYSITGQSLQRTENSTLTTIATSANTLLPSTLDVELANTEYTQSSVTFKPTFISTDGLLNQYDTDGVSWAERGTTIFSKSYLRNKRRG